MYYVRKYVPSTRHAAFILAREGSREGEISKQTERRGKSRAKSHFSQKKGGGCKKREKPIRDRNFRIENIRKSDSAELFRLIGVA